jgi:hypothetical protein
MLRIAQPGMTNFIFVKHSFVRGGAAEKLIQHAL